MGRSQLCFRGGILPISFKSKCNIAVSSGLQMDPTDRMIVLLSAKIVLPIANKAVSFFLSCFLPSFKYSLAQYRL